MDANSAAIERLGLPAYTWRNEALHGVVANEDHHTTVFPQSIGMASTWDPELMSKEAKVISDEARAIANLLNNAKYLNFWSPMINMVRDPRWGRTQESYGEDPFLAGQIALEFVKGLQGDNNKYFKALATPKHFVANNEDWNRHFCDAVVEEKLLREYYFKAFKTCVIEGNAQSIMGAYNAVNGIPSCCNEFLLQDVLRDEWGFNGHIVSDCGALYNIHANHKYTKTPEEAVARSVVAGTDLNCGSQYSLHLKDAVEAGHLDESDIDIALRRILKARFELGMFDPPEMVPFSRITSDVIDSREHRQLAKETARESIVLLKNKGGFLPLSKDIGSIAVIGPNANMSQFGHYSGKPSYDVTPLEGIRNIVSPETIIKHAQGADLPDNKLPIIPSRNFIPPDAKKGEYGLLGEYFNNMNFEGEPVLTRIDSVLKMEWWDASTFPDSIVNTDHFSVRWTGKIIPDKSERYMLSARTTVASSSEDVGMRIYLDGELILDQGTSRLMWDNAITRPLVAGKAYDFKVEYIEDIDWASVVVGWEPVGGDPIPAAVEIAKEVDVVILVMGTNHVLEGELGDRTSLDLPQNQQDLIRQVVAANPNTVLILVNGSPLALNWENEHIPAIVEAWYPGQEGGNAIADVLFGEHNPGGKLPVTFYTGLDQLPDIHDYDITKGRTYMYLKERPLYPFGYGLSYTDFKASDFSLSEENDRSGDHVSVSLNVENTGGMAGSEVLQLYVHSRKDTKYTPIKQLKAFKKIFLKAGEQKRVTLSFPVDDLATYHMEEASWVVESGTYDIMVGNSSDNFFYQDEIVISE